uniref:Uncharacterized protein n=1 Tax=Cacopsylla melanoneura TaxID=428564 RepID=A0A8D8R2K1_9HEMI
MKTMALMISTIWRTCGTINLSKNVVPLRIMTTVCLICTTAGGQIGTVTITTPTMGQEAAEEELVATTVGMQPAGDQTMIQTSEIGTKGGPLLPGVPLTS